MVASDKRAAPHLVSSTVFLHLSAVFSRPEGPSDDLLSSALSDALRDVDVRAKVAELKGLRDTLGLLVNRVNDLILFEEARPDARARALEEDSAVQAALDAAQRQGRRAMTTPKSIHQGQAAMMRASETSAATTTSLIASGHLVTSAELQHLLKMQRQAISGAVKAGRLFAIVGPSGKNFYPAFYADPSLDRRTVERVTKALGSLPAEAKYYFFTRNSTNLQGTALDALRKGRVDEVMASAAGFAEQ